MLHKIFCSVTEPNFKVDDLSIDEKEKLAEAVQNGLIAKINNCYKPNFVVMMPEQLAKLQKDIYAPLLLSITPKMKELAEIFREMYRSEFPKTSHGYIDYHTYMDLWDFGVFTLMFAAEDGKLYLPETPEKGIPLTLVIIKMSCHCIDSPVLSPSFLLHKFKEILIRSRSKSGRCPILFTYRQLNILCKNGQQQII